MAAISFINPKGGSGKTTLAMVLAQEFASRGGSVAIIDADPNAVIQRWANIRESRKAPLPFYVESCTEESRIARLAEQLSDKYDFVFIDLEGTASKMSSRAMTRSHLVLIPLNPSSIDANLASKAVDLVDEESHVIQRNIPFRLVRSRDAAAVQSKTLKRIKLALETNGIPCLKTGLVERAAFRDIFEFSKTLMELDPKETSNIEQAKRNAAEIANEVLVVLKEIAQG
jgi:chromosome partitioning protein